MTDRKRPSDGRATTRRQYLSGAAAGPIGVLATRWRRRRSDQPDPPSPVSPKSGADVTDFALTFYAPTGDLRNLEFQAARTQAFDDPVRTGKGAVWMPDEPFAPGTWYWRVRGVKPSFERTDWSEPVEFTVNDDHTRADPPFRPGPESPLFILESWDATRQWAHVPADLREYVAFKHRPILYDFRLRENTTRWMETMRAFDENDIPVFVLGHVDQYPSAELERLYREVDAVKGIVLRELMWWHSWHGFRGPGSVSDIITHHLQLAAKHGKQVVWTDGHWRHLLFLEAGVEQELMNTVSEYAEYLLPIVKLNFAYHPTVVQSLLQGWWFGDAVEAWGHQPESWYHHGGGPGAKWRGPRETCPPMFYADMVLSGVRAGASVFSFEPPNDIWVAGDGLRADQDSGRTEGFSRTWAEIMLPLFREIVTERLVPSRETVATSSPAAITYDETVFRTADGKPGDYWQALNNGPTYDRTWDRVNGPLSTLQQWRHEAEVIPNTGRYDFLPYVPAHLVDEDEYETVISLQTANRRRGQSDGSLRETLGELYEPVGEGSATITHAGDVYVILNNRERRVTDRQDFDVSASGGPVSAISGELGRHGFVLFEKRGRSDRIYTHGRRAGGAGEIVLTLTLESEDVDVGTSPASQVATRERDGTRVTFDLSFDAGPTILTASRPEPAATPVRTETDTPTRTSSRETTAGDGQGFGGMAAGAGVAGGSYWYFRRRTGSEED